MKASGGKRTGAATHQQLERGCDRWFDDLRAAREQAVTDPRSRRAWDALAAAAREIEADSLLAGEMHLAYVATKLDVAVTDAVASGLPPAETELAEIGELVKLLDERYATLETR